MSVEATAAAQLEVLRAEAPAAALLLSPLGRRAALPLGIPQQAAQAAACERQATIGQITSGAGHPLALPAIGALFAGLPPRQAFLYAPTAGLYALRQAWNARLVSRSPEPFPECSLPVVTNGMSHGLSLVADLFSSPTQPLVLATPYWDNYETIWNMRNGAEMLSFPFFSTPSHGAPGFNLAGMSARLDELDGPASLLLNFPNNPTGYAPTKAEAAAIIARIHAHPHPLCVLCDDAYHGLYFDPACYGRSLFGALVAGGDRRKLLVCKVDGATKELVFFGGRVGFLTFGVGGKAGEVLAEKAAAVLRGTISSCSAPAQSAVLAALADPMLDAQSDEVFGVLAQRYAALQRELRAQGVAAYPFNSGCFAMVQLKEGADSDTVRRRLIHEQSTGVIAVPDANALRVAFCSVEESDIPDLVRRIAAVVNE